MTARLVEVDASVVQARVEHRGARVEQLVPQHGTLERPTHRRLSWRTPHPSGGERDEHRDTYAENALHRSTIMSRHVVHRFTTPTVARRTIRPPVTAS
jgi:hypothetical protein